MDKPKLHRIENVPIFEAGEWKGGKLKYSLDRLKQIVASANELKDRIKPYIYLGHSSGDEMAKFAGQPSVGILENIRLIGNRIVADFADIPEKVFQVLQGKGYRRWSVEIARDWIDSVSKKTHERLLTGIALLGAEHPAVNTLPDSIDGYAALYYSDELEFDHLESGMKVEIEEVVKEVPTVILNAITTGGDKMDEKEVKALQDKVDKLTDALKAAEQAQVVTNQASIDKATALEKELQAAKDELAERDNTAKTQRITEFLHEQKELGKLTKAMEDVFARDLQHAEDFEAAFKSMKAMFDATPKDIIHDEQLADVKPEDMPDAFRKQYFQDRFTDDMKHTGNKPPEDMSLVEEFADVFAKFKPGERAQNLHRAREAERKELLSYL